MGSKRGWSGVGPSASREWITPRLELRITPQPSTLLEQQTKTYVREKKGYKLGSAPFALFPEPSIKRRDGVGGAPGAREQREGVVVGGERCRPPSGGRRRRAESWWVEPSCSRTLQGCDDACAKAGGGPWVCAPPLHQSILRWQGCSVACLVGGSEMEWSRRLSVWAGQ